MKPSPHVPVSPRQLLQLLHRASAAANGVFGGSSTHPAGVCEAVACEFEAHYQSDPAIHVFRRGKKAEPFVRGTSRSRNEFMFDISVVEIGTLRPPVHRSARPIAYIRTPLLQVESELSVNTAASCEDFTKLVCGSAWQKLFIGPYSARQERYLDTYREIAPFVPGELFVTFFPRTSRLIQPNPPPLYRWEAGDWKLQTDFE